MTNPSYLLFSLLLTLICLACGQGDQDIDYLDGYIGHVETSDPVHNKHLGKILFTDEYIRAGDYENNNYFSEMNLSLDGNPSKNLYLRAYFDKSITNYLQELGPEMSVQDLLRNGNYQFTFLVDDKHIYTEDVNKGAGLPFAKNQELTLCKPLATKEHIDSWGCFLWKRFMMRNGGQKALTLGSHKLTIQLRVYLNADTKQVSDIIASGSILLNMVEDYTDFDPNLVAIQKIEPHTDFEISNVSLDKSRIEKMNAKIHSNSYKEVTSVVTLLNGEIALEQYFNSADRQTMHDTRSVGKTMTGMIMGIAIDEGLLENEYTTLGQLYPLKEYGQFSEKKANVTIHDLLTMTSVLDGSDMDSNSPGNEDVIQETSNWMQTVMNLGTKENNNKWDYFTGGTMILSDIIQKRTPDGLEEFAKSNLFQPLGINSADWFHTPQGVPYGGGGLKLTSLDLAKLGLLYQNKGQWNGQQIISKEWIDKSLTNHVELPEQIKGSYGYLWYNTTVEYNNTPHQISYAAGNGGNFIYVFKDLPIVVVITASAYNTMEGSVQGMNMLEKFILPSIQQIEK